MTTNRGDDLPEGDEMELVMPFVTVVSAGGPHDDDSFAAGWQAGEIDRSLSVAEPAVVSVCFAVVRRDVVPQLELVGMRHGFPTLHVTPTSDEWCTVTFWRSETSPV